jgi:hypothetical protein
LFAPKTTSADDIEALARMGYASPAGAGEALYAKLVTLALRSTR